MWSILKREVRNYMKNPLFWIGIAVGVWMIFQDTGPYLDIHYLKEGETIVNDYPEMHRDGDVFDGYVPTEKEPRRKMWEERIREILVSEFEMEDAKAQSVIDEMKGMDIAEASRHLEEYGFYDAHYEYVNTAYHKGTREEINAFIEGKLKNKTFSYYFSRKFADFAGLFMGFFATVLLSMLFMQDTRRNTYELLHTKPVSAGKYLSGKVGGGFTVCLIILAILNLIFFGLCLVSAGDSGFTVRLSDFLLATCLYILPNMLMIVSVYSLVSLLCKSPLPAVPLLLLYIVYSNMGSRNAEGVCGYYGRPLAIMVRFQGRFFDTAPPPMALFNQSMLLLASAVLTGISILWFVLPGYLIALLLAFFVSPTFTAIAFDAGGVASGPLTATFMLPFAMGACEALGGDILSDAFGIVALVAMTPLVTIQILGLWYQLKTKAAAILPSAMEPDDIIEYDLTPVAE